MRSRRRRRRRGSTRASSGRARTAPVTARPRSRVCARSSNGSRASCRMRASPTRRRARSSRPRRRSVRSTSPSSKPSGVNTAWIESLSPWPTDGFGLERMQALLAELGEPQRRYRSIHVVGTNGKSTVTWTAAAILRREGLRVGAYTSPHVSGWAERIQVDGEPADFEAALTRVREPGERLGATQFEILTAAAFAEFVAAGVDAAVVEAGPRGGGAPAQGHRWPWG